VATSKRRSAGGDHVPYSVLTKGQMIEITFNNNRLAPFPH